MKTTMQTLADGKAAERAADLIRMQHGLSQAGSAELLQQR